MSGPKISLDAILLFALSIPFVMKYRISPGETPYWLFGLIFFLLFIYFFLKKSRIKTAFIWAIIILTIGNAYFSSIIVRRASAPEFGVHDIVLQLESAIQFFLQGKNPYAVSYFGTPLEKWHYGENVVNPALYHFVMPPFYLLFSLPFYFLSISLFGFFDGRLPLIFGFLGGLGILSNWIGNSEKRNLALILFAFNPATVDYFLEGRSDFFMLFFLLASLYLLSMRIHAGGKADSRGYGLIASGLLMGLAFSVKQSAWPILPFYLAYLWFKGKWDWLLKAGVTLFLTIVIFNLPFLVWDYKAFLNSIIFYLAGSLPTSYPVSGYGFGMVLHELGFIKDLQGYYPFWFWQVIIGLPLMVLLVKWMRKENTVKRLLLSYGVFLFVFWYFARYLNNSHLGYISSVFLVGYFVDSWSHSDPERAKRVEGEESPTNVGSRMRERSFVVFDSSGRQ